MIPGLYTYFGSAAATQPAAVAQLDARPTGDQKVAGSTLQGQQHSFMEYDHEIFSTGILSFR